MMRLRVVPRLARRVAPALSAFLILCMPLACSDSEEEVSSGWERTGSSDSGWSQPPASGTGGGSDSVVKLPDAIAIPASSERLKVRVTIDGNAVTRKITEGALSVEGYYKVQLSSANLPRASAVPTFRWSDDGLDRSWPEEFELVLPKDGSSYLVAWLDLDRNGELSTGDRISRPLDPLEAVPAEGLAIRVDRIFVDPTAPARDAGPPDGARNGGPEDGERSRRTPAPGPPDAGCWGWFGGGARERYGVRGASEGAGVTIERTVLVDASPATREAGKGKVLIYGFPDDQLDEYGMPGKGVPPTYIWTDKKKTKRWPIEREVALPEDPELRLLAVLDLGGDGRLSEGDHLGKPVKLAEAMGEGGKVSLMIAAPLDASDQEEEFRVTAKPGAVAPEPVPSPGSETGKFSTLRVAVEVSAAAEAAGSGPVLLYGYRTEELDFTDTLLEATPVYLWSSGTKYTQWPANLAVKLPAIFDPGSEEGSVPLTLIAVLDLDLDGRLSYGDFVSRPLRRAEVDESPFKIDVEVGQTGVGQQ
ncbi:MAG: hypothetical protein VX498_05410 [Myxococcota bacterium]|nr:hypothetical protein [Myxococcota bacterium]